MAPKYVVVLACTVVVSCTTNGYMYHEREARTFMIPPSDVQIEAFNTCLKGKSARPCPMPQSTTHKESWTSPIPWKYLPNVTNTYYATRAQREAMGWVNPQVRLDREAVGCGLPPSDVENGELCSRDNDKSRRGAAAQTPEANSPTSPTPPRDTSPPSRPSPGPTPGGGMPGMMGPGKD